VIVIKELIFDVDRDEPVDARTYHCPFSVDGFNLDSYLEQMYGPPLHEVYTSTEHDARLVIGWSYPVGGDVVAPDGATYERFVIPMIRLEDTRELVSMFMHLAEQRRWFEQMEAAGEDVQWIEGEATKWSPDAE
jgi:hypothetical protein